MTYQFAGFYRNLNILRISRQFAVCLGKKLVNKHDITCQLGYICHAVPALLVGIIVGSLPTVNSPLLYDGKLQSLVGCSDRPIRHFYIKLCNELIRSAFGAFSVREGMIEIIAVLMSAFHSVFCVSTYGTAITRCRTACCHVPMGCIFCTAIHAEEEVSFSLGEIFCGKRVCVFYFLLIRGSADLTFRTCKTRRFSAVVFFFNGVAVFVFFNFAATTL